MSNKYEICVGSPFYDYMNDLTRVPLSDLLTICHSGVFRAKIFKYGNIVSEEVARVSFRMMDNNNITVIASIAHGNLDPTFDEVHIVDERNNLTLFKIYEQFSVYLREYGFITYYMDIYRIPISL